MTSDGNTATEAFVWIWLPGHVDPVVAGRLQQIGDRIQFNYGRSYLERADAIPIYLPELPLRRGSIEPLNGLGMASAIRDGSPDAWGRRVILNRLAGAGEIAPGASDVSELTFLLESGSDRIGALDFQRSSDVYVPRDKKAATYEELLEAADRVERGMPLSPALDAALNHGTSIGGARPKALIDRDDRKLIAKFSSSGDLYSVVKAEFIAMRFADECGLQAAPVSLISAGGKDVLLIERFDRDKTSEGWTRRAMVSALTILGLDELMARYASYLDLAEAIRHRFTDPQGTLRELFGRMCFNILCGNTDDHARNHAAFWDGKGLTLTPAYDICPQGRTGQEASQAMAIGDKDRRSTLDACLKVCGAFFLTEADATAIMVDQIRTIAQRWDDVCAEAELSGVDRALFAGRQFLNPYAIAGVSSEQRGLNEAFDQARRQIMIHDEPL